MSADEPLAAGDAIEIFADWLSRRQSGEQVEFDDLLRGHPQRASELAELQATWKRLAAANDPSHASLSLQERIRSRFGTASVPEVSLQEPRKAETRSDFSSLLIAQVAAHSTGFGRYRIRGEVARGGMGVILKIWDEDLRRHLAMKMILGKAEAPASGATPSIDSTRVARFLEEAQVTGQLDHPGIVPVHELGLDPEGRLYFTMKLVKGRSLKEVFDLVAEGEEGWTQTRALGVLLKVCEAMAYAHDKGVIHRDLKPANIMVGKFGEVHVMDWGLARILDQPDEKDIRIREEVPLSTELRSHRKEHRGETPESPLYTMDGDVVGTPAYMPPEQAAGRQSQVGQHSDVYALGAMLYHLLAGHMPYVPKSAKLNNYAIWALVQQSPPLPIAQLSRETPAELLAICDKAMARDWKQRYRDMSELAADLSAYLEHRVVSAYETGRWAETKKWVERNKPLAASIAAGVLALAAGLLVSLSLKREADASATDARRQEGIAKTNAHLAEERRVRAEASEQEAKQQEELARRQTANVLRLSAFQTLDDLTREADELWPPEPQIVERLGAWLARADELLGKTPEFRASLDELGQLAPPQTEEEHAADRRNHPRFAELEQAKGSLQYFSRLLGEEDWPSESSVEAELAKETLPADANGLNRLAWSMMNDEMPVLGSEVKALLLARRAVALASGEAERARLRETLANALSRLGRFEEALAEERRALAEAEEHERQEFEAGVADFEHALKVFQGDGRANVVKARDNAVRRVTELEAEVSRRRSWNFEENEDRWWYAQMEKLVAALSDFGNEQTGLVRGVSPVHGWGVRQRLEFAASIEARSVSGPEAAKRWAEAIEAIGKSEKYGGMKWHGGKQLAPQMGLLPIGADPDSGLWEFSHLATSENFEPAERGADGRLLLNEGMGLVFVLIPGGSFWMGAQSRAPGDRNYEPQALGDELPVNEVPLAPYFLSKYELTQGQWVRLTGANPSDYTLAVYNESWNRGGRSWSALQPVERVSWIECTSQMQRLGLVLPTEAQWERGCRGGTSSAYWSGDDTEPLPGVANVADEYAKRHGGSAWLVVFEAWDDGNTSTAEIGSYRANPFGLHDVHGNVSELCRDAYSENAYTWPTRAGDGGRVSLTSPGEGTQCAIRGGDFGHEAASARSAFRNATRAEVGSSNVGLRPARSITP